MAFDLPRSPRSLRFTGSVRALSKDEGAPGALGRARPDAPPPSAARSVPMGRLAPPAGRPTTPPRLTTTRGHVESIADDDQLTLCLDRDALDIAQLPDARHGKNLPPHAKPGPNLPVPGFRSRNDVAWHNHEPAIMRPPQVASLPVGVWLFAALIAGIVSFHVAPQARESLQAAVRAFDPPR